MNKMERFEKVPHGRYINFARPIPKLQRRRSGVAPEVASWGAPSRCCYLGR